MAPRKDDSNDAPIAGAWERDKQFGVRLDQVFPAAPDKPGEHFLILGAKVDGTIETELGQAEHVSLLVQRLDERDKPTGMPFKVGTLASAIVEKMKAAVPETDFPAVVQTMMVEGRFDKAKGGGARTLVLQHVGDADPSSLLDEFGVTGDTLARVDQLRPENERIPL